MNLFRPGQFLYGIGIAAIGIHQIITRTFRPDILPPFSWANRYSFLPVLIGIGLTVAGIAVIKSRTVAMYLAVAFFILIVTFHLPYIFLVSDGSLSSLQIWFGVGEALAYCGGALVIANLYTRIGEIFYSTLIILFGISHFVYTDYVATMIPGFFGSALFWVYLVGVLLIGAGIAIVLRIWIKTVALLLAIMLFLFFIFFHVPDAIANPTVGGGNEIVRAIICLLFCGIAMVIAAGERSSPPVAAH